MRKKEPDSIAVMTMPIDRILEHLSSLKENRESFVSEDGDDQVWRDDAKAIDAATAILSYTRDAGICDAEGLKDLIYDYDALAKQNREMHRRYETATRVIWRDGVWHCPRCNHRVAPRHSYCHWCGKKLGGC